MVRAASDPGTRGLVGVAVDGGLLRGRYGNADRVGAGVAVTGRGTVVGGGVCRVLDAGTSHTGPIAEEATHVNWTDVTMPENIALLPRDHVGRPVPYFVEWINGQPDFRVASRERLHGAVRFGLCQVCGKELGEWKTFVIGPMCAVNRISAEPPSHRACALYAAKACPFLTTPGMRRRPRGLPEDYIDPPGTMILRNPGVTLVWRTARFTVLREPTGMLFEIGAPAEVVWLCRGQRATRTEIIASLESGFPLLREAAERDPHPLAALADINRRIAAARALVPRR